MYFSTSYEFVLKENLLILRMYLKVASNRRYTLYAGNMFRVHMQAIWKEAEAICDFFSNLNKTANS